MKSDETIETRLEQIVKLLEDIRKVLEPIKAKAMSEPQTTAPIPPARP